MYIGNFNFLDNEENKWLLAVTLTSQFSFNYEIHLYTIITLIKQILFVGEFFYSLSFQMIYLNLFQSLWKFKSILKDKAKEKFPFY